MVRALTGCLVAIVIVLLGSSAGLGKEVKAYETPLQTRLDWANSAQREKHAENWTKDFKARYWTSWWRENDKYLLVMLLELAPNVYWKRNKDWTKSEKGVETEVRSFWGEKADVRASDRFVCAALACVPFTDDREWNCTYFRIDNFTRGPAKSEGILSRGEENASTLKGAYCLRGQDTSRTEIDEVINSFYIDRRSNTAR